ncbi:MAG: hypothetical protein AABX51_02240 [Nanoarchaeota archaeon]
MTLDEKVMGRWHHMLGNPTGSALAGIGQIQRRGERVPDAISTIEASREEYLVACQQLLSTDNNFKDYNPKQADREFLQGLYEKAQIIDWENGDKVRELKEELREYTSYKPFSD